MRYNNGSVHTEYLPIEFCWRRRTFIHIESAQSECKVDATLPPPPWLGLGGCGELLPLVDSPLFSLPLQTLQKMFTLAVPTVHGAELRSTSWDFFSENSTLFCNWSWSWWLLFTIPALMLLWLFVRKYMSLGENAHVKKGSERWLLQAISGNISPVASLQTGQEFFPTTSFYFHRGMMTSVSFI